MHKPKIVTFYIGGFKIPFSVYDDSNIVNQMKLYSGVWEPMHTLILMMLSAEVRSIHVNPIFIDIGAYCGYFSVIIAHFFPEIEVHAIEPHPLNYELLKSNTARYDNIYTHNYAIGDKTNNAHLYFSKYSTSGASLDRGTIPQPRVDYVSVKVKQLKDCGIDLNRVFFIKIDTQGNESKILDNIKNDIVSSCRISAEDDTKMEEYLKDNKQYQRLAVVNENIFIIGKK